MNLEEVDGEVEYKDEKNVVCAKEKGHTCLNRPEIYGYIQ